MSIKVEIVMVAGDLDLDDFWLTPRIECALLTVCLMPSPLLKYLECDVLLRADVLADHRQDAWICDLDL